MCAYISVWDTGSKERQKEAEDENQRVKGRWKGVKEERAGYRSPFAPAAARPVQHRGQLPPLSRSELRAAAHSPISGRNLLREEKEREGHDGSWGFPVLSPLRPNSALIPSPGITAADFNLVSRGPSLLPTRCGGPGSPRSEFRLGVEFVTPAPPGPQPPRICSQTTSRLAFLRRKSGEGDANTSRRSSVAADTHGGPGRLSFVYPEARAANPRAGNRNPKRKAGGGFLPMRPGPGAKQCVPLGSESWHPAARTPRCFLSLSSGRESGSQFNKLRPRRRVKAQLFSWALP